MTDTRFAHVGSPEDRLIEECAELIQAVTKAKRFGWFNYHPDHPSRTNHEDVKREMDDVVEAIERLSVQMRFIAIAHFDEEPPK